MTQCVREETGGCCKPPGVRDELGLSAGERERV